MTAERDARVTVPAVRCLTSGATNKAHKPLPYADAGAKPGLDHFSCRISISASP
jgi:hypothetical protein